jgi:hypothetical protein
MATVERGCQTIRQKEEEREREIRPQTLKKKKKKNIKRNNNGREDQRDFMRETENRKKKKSGRKDTQRARSIKIREVKTSEGPTKYYAISEKKKRRS